MEFNILIENVFFLIKLENNRQIFADKTNISINTVKKLLTKKNIPTLETLIKISKTLNISLDDLVYKDLSK